MTLGQETHVEDVGATLARSSQHLDELFDDLRDRHHVDVDAIGREQIRRDLRDLFFGSDLGVRVLDHLMQCARFWRPSMTGNSYTYFNEGMKYLIFLIMQAGGMDNVTGLLDILQVRAVQEQRVQHMHDQADDQ